MKKINLFVILALLYSLSGNSQIEKGNWLVGGSVNLTSYKNEYISGDSAIKSELKGRGINIYPTIGYFLSDKFAIGLSPTYGYSETQNTSGSSYGIGPFARYYLLKPEKVINFLTQVSYTYSEGGNSISNSYTVKAGPTIFFNETAALEITLDYINGNNKSEQGSVVKGSSFNIGLGLQIHLTK